MPLLLPFMKLFVNDWLTSEKIALMEPPHIGCYIMLLTQCWTQPTCTLPNDILVLKKLSRWNDEKWGDFSPVFACFTPVKKTGRVTNARLYEEWTKAQARNALYRQSGQRGAAKRWAGTSAREITRTTESKKSSDWMATLKALPIYAHVNWARELGKIAEWKSRPQNAHRIINQKFMANWLNKIEPPLPNGHAGPPHCPICKKDYADAAALDHHNFLYHPKFVG